MGPNSSQKICTAKETIKKMKTTIHRVGENICKWSNQWEINLQYIQFHAAQLKKKKNKHLRSKMVEE